MQTLAMAMQHQVVRNSKRSCMLSDRYGSCSLSEQYAMLELRYVCLLPSLVYTDTYTTDLKHLS